MPVDKRYQIFISSTFKNLFEERKQAIEVIFEMGHIPIALERFSPANQNDLQVIQKVIAECQIYILILGHKYGAIIPDKEISYTELEYNIAEKNGLMILPLILDDEETKKLRKEFNYDDKEDSREMENEKKYNKFRSKIAQFSRMWKKEDQFKYLVGMALATNIPHCTKPGFIKENEEPLNELLASASRNEFIVDIIEQLKSFNKLYERCSQRSELKKELSDYFRERYLDKIIKHKVSLFLESGSTIAYTAKAISDTLQRVVKTKDKGKPNIHIATNNVLAYLQLWLISKIPCTTFPWSPPIENTYGALYGSLVRIEDRRPSYESNTIDDVARNEINRLSNSEFGITSFPKPTVILSTLSGLQVSSQHDLKFQAGLDPEIKEILRPQLNNCFGPHVGSYRNMIFKRFLYETGIPIIFFLTAEKINCEIDVGKCHFVFDESFPWVKFYTQNPIAFCVGCEQNKSTGIKKIFEDLGFKIKYRSCCSVNTSFIARNEPFINQFESALNL